MNSIIAAILMFGAAGHCEPKLNAPVKVPSAHGEYVELVPNTAERFCVAGVLNDPTFGEGGDAPEASGDE